jgi:hypothetical protein
MKYFYVEPEVAGGLGERTVMDRSTHPPVVKRLHYQLEGWLGDAILARSMALASPMRWSSRSTMAVPKSLPRR